MRRRRDGAQDRQTGAFFVFTTRKRALRPERTDKWQRSTKKRGPASIRSWRSACRRRLVAVVAFFIFRTLAGADVFVVFCGRLHWKTLAEMYHHRCVKKWLITELFKPEEILDIRIFGYRFDSFLISEIFLFFDIDRSIGNSGGKRRAACLLAHAFEIDFLDVIPRHDLRHTDPAVILFQFPAEGKKELVDPKLIPVIFVVHKPPQNHVFSRKIAISGCLYDTTKQDLSKLFWLNYRILFDLHC